ncbi:WD repeat-containing protein WRAP73 [Tolypocladium ophioglossoides CBS 100239]|uniref:WD repeat-containing protein WRAP73 n=1 Tax=Tolypocladium ophioglossoides (strain CBS 100239) TaxID=1163406 RepID=A0A0L0NLQ0_TOLOC|nr:WD repeat-containing protein WRAP73 [Tolypocladium ophioglossoides CBS 100239]KND94968.1 WD repeat-containing protein WRAP73 [Tolypocladium ophioglossoides CBS 100239]
MHTSRVFKSSPQCKPSPDGRFVATLGSSAISIRSTASLRLVNVVRLPPELSGPVSGFLWAPSSSRVLVSTADQIQIFSAVDSSFHATIRNPASAGGKAPVIYFGARDTEVLACSAFGLKLAIIDLSTSKVVEIGNPKFHHPSSASRGLSIRPDTGHLALLTRVGGKDVISIHDPATRQVERSWCPETIDGQGLSWTRDGQWLLLWESPAQGRRLFLYTPDGQHFRTIGASGLSQGQSSNADAILEPGIKVCQLSSNAELCAIGDHSRRVAVLSTQTWRETVSLLHPSTIVPMDTLQVWQEQLGAAGERRSTHAFLRATQMVAPPGPWPDAKSAVSVSPGCSLAAFDASSTLLATRLDDSPGTIWIWDVAAAELRAVLIFHSNAGFSWHPSSRELLLVTCQDDARHGASFVWDPVSNGPTSVSPEDYLPAVKAVGKTRVSWINRESEFPELLLADAERCMLLSLSDAGDGPNPWQDDGGGEWDGASAAREDGETTGRPAVLDVEDISALDDTFSFRNA